MATYNDDQINDLKKQVEDLSTRLKEIGKQEARQMSGKMEDYMEVAKEKASDLTDQSKEKLQLATEKAKEVGKKADSFAHEKPWMAVGIAAVMGMLVGKLLTKNKE